MNKKELETMLLLGQGTYGSSQGAIKKKGAEKDSSLAVLMLLAGNPNVNFYS